MLLAQNTNKEVKFSIIETSDVHGNYFPYDFINDKPGEGSLSRISTYVKRLRAEQGEGRVLLVDNGDILQGQPAAYYYNYVDTTSTHLCARMLNEMGYLCGTLGNHDIETGHSVYDRWMDDCGFAVLGANVVDKRKNKLYLTAYVQEEVDGVRIGVLGMVTPTGRMLDHAAFQVAEQVPDIDVLFCGHDHRVANTIVTNKISGRQTLILNPGANAMNIAQADIKVTLGADGKRKKKEIVGNVIDIRGEEPDSVFLSHYAKEFNDIRKFTTQVVGHNRNELDTRSAYFGSSAFVDFIHRIQLAVSGADISFAAPLSYDAKVEAGNISMADLFNLYKYENQLYVMKLSGQEIKNYLEESYGIWTRQMKAPSDHMILLNENYEKATEPWQRLQHSSYNFDSAAGIKYTVDLRKPKGEKITILSMADGKPFDLQKTYKVALNSYRANGGGGLLIKGAGIPQNLLRSRVIWTSDREMREYLRREIARHQEINPQPLNNWRFIPEGWAAAAAERDSEIMFK